MITKFYIDISGNYLGGFGGAEPPIGSVEVTSPPESISSKFVGGVWVPYMPTLAEAKAAQIAKINQSADTAFSAITSSYPKQEVDTWANQYAEAQAYQLNALAATPTLSAIALAYGTTVPLLVTSVLQKATAYAGASGQTVGKRKLLTDQINAATTNAAVGTILW